MPEPATQRCSPKVRKLEPGQLRHPIALGDTRREGPASPSWLPQDWQDAQIKSILNTPEFNLRLFKRWLSLHEIASSHRLGKGLQPKSRRLLYRPPGSEAGPPLAVTRMWVPAPVQTRGGLEKEGGPVPTRKETHLRPPRCSARRAPKQFINSATFPTEKVEKIKTYVLVAAKACGEQKPRRAVGVTQICPHTDAHVPASPRRRREPQHWSCVFLKPGLSRRSRYRSLEQRTNNLDQDLSLPVALIFF